MGWSASDTSRPSGREAARFGHLGSHVPHLARRSAAWSEQHSVHAAGWSADEFGARWSLLRRHRVVGGHGRRRVAVRQVVRLDRLRRAPAHRLSLRSPPPHLPRWRRQPPQATYATFNPREHDVLDQHPQDADAPSLEEPASGDASNSPDTPAAMAERAMMSWSPASGG